jgi:GT2 family glycosyltransferase
MIDIFITSYLREKYTGETLRYLKERTHHPYRTFLIDNGGNEIHKDKVDYYIGLSKNIGIHAAWNMALSLAEGEFFITSDNDIYVPDLDPDWLSQLVGLMVDRPDFGAISLHPHVFIGINGEDPLDPESVKDAPMAGAVMRIMRTEAVRKVGGWDHHIEAGRNHEERTISSRLRDAGYKVGRTTRIRAFHPFGDNWGYPPEFTPEMQKHNPELNSYVNQFNNMEAYDEKTWLPR